VIGEIFITRILIISAILFIISSENIKEVGGRWNEQINSKNKKVVKRAKREKRITTIFLFILSIFLTFVSINVTHKYFYKTPIIELATFKKSLMLDSIARQFYRMVETGRIIKEVD
jgi:hypothetical protein